MALKAVITEAIEAASGGILLNLFNKLFEAAKSDDWKGFRQKVVSSGILPFSLSREDEAKLIVRFGKIKDGLSASEALILGKFLTEKCTNKERNSLRCSIALIDEVQRSTKVIYEDTDKKKKRTVERQEIVDYGLEFLKKLADSSLDDDKRYAICKGLGIFDFSESAQKAWEQVQTSFGAVDEAFNSAAEKIRDSLLPKPSRWGYFNPKNWL